MMKGIARLTSTLVIDPLNEIALKPVAPNNTADTSDKIPDRYPSWSDPLSEIQQGSHSIAENTNARHVHTSVDSPSRMVAFMGW